MMKRTMLIASMSLMLAVVLLVSPASATVLAVSQYTPKQVVTVDTASPAAWTTIWDNSVPYNDYSNYSPGGIAFGSNGTAYLGFTAGSSGGLLKANYPYGAGAWSAATDTNKLWKCLTFGPDGYLYGANSTDVAVSRIDVSTGEMTTVISGGSLTAPRSVVFDSNGKLYVSDYNSDSILRYANNAGTWELDYTFTSALLDNPEQIAFGPDGKLYAVSRNLHQIVKFDTTTGDASVFAGTATWSTSLMGIAIDQETGDVYASYLNGQVIYVYGSNGVRKTDATLTMPTIEGQTKYGGYLTIFTPVPEPATMVLLGFGGLAMFYSKRRKNG